MKYKDGSESRVGDVIRWKCYDSDDFHVWTFTGMVKRDGVLYLGGGIDFGMAIGSIFSFDQVINESECHDEDDVGIEKLCVASVFSHYIDAFMGGV